MVVNFIISEFDLKVDLSTQEFFTLTDKTKELVNDLEDDVTIYYLIEAGKETPFFQKLAEKYDNMSDKIELVQKDPVLYPRFAYQYVGEDVQVNPNSFLVVNNKTNRAKYIDSEEMIVKGKEFNYEIMDFPTEGIDVEGKITSAIQYVTDPDLPVIYMTTGHGEWEEGELFHSLLNKQNVTVNELSTLTVDRIPEDCDILFINAPKTDFTEDEVAMIKEYMAAGGNVNLVLNYEAEGAVNIASLLDHYGISIVKGFVVEGNPNMHATNGAHYLIPQILNHAITNTAINSKKPIISPFSIGLAENDTKRKSLTVEPLLVTSDAAYSKVDMHATTLEKEQGDIDGPFYLGLISTDTYENTNSKLVVYTSPIIFDETALQMFGNEDLLLGTVSSLSGKVSSISIKHRSVLREFLHLTQSEALFWGAITVIVIPLLILGVGVFISIKRRRR
nr:GldG family protein [Mobilitalea sibirica]